MTMFFPIYRFATLLALVVLLGAFPVASPLAAATSNVTTTDHTTVRLLSASEGVGDARTLTFGLHFTLKPGWKVYWRSPGDAGYPPTLDWTDSLNIANAEMLWPIPHRFSILGLETLGYKDEIVYPITLTPTTPGEAVHAVALVDYLACNEICVPYQTTLTLDLPAGPAAPSPYTHLINRYAVQVPGNGVAHGLSLDKLEVTGSGKGTFLRLTAVAKTPFEEPDVFFEGPDLLAFDKPTVTLGREGLQAILTTKVYGAEDLTPPNVLEGLNLQATLTDGARAATAALVVEKGGTGPVRNGSGAGISLLSILGFALLGGLILNLMPCVLPVLSIKLLSIVGHGGGERRAVQWSFIASAAGIVFAFLVLASALVIVKGAGMTIGWGIQFQQPWFLIAMTFIITLFACNLWGLFEFRLPAWMSDVSVRSAHIGGLSGHFLTGCFATLLATPCSAPFLGTAVGFALAREAGDIYAVFSALGVGLALPYLMVALFPGLATRLPKPGHWMVVLRKVMGVALAVTGIWLLSVLSNAIGTNIGLSVGGLMLGIIMVLYIGQRLNRLWLIGGTGAVVLALLAFAIPALLPQNAPGARILDKDPRFQALWKPFNEQAIPGLVKEGKTVFVDVTADWCLTCQVNKSLVLAQEEMLNRLSGEDVIAMQADWTLPDDTIAAYLASFGRYGIPFNAVYGPSQPEGLTLPELLSPDAVNSALDRAAPAK